MTNLAQVQAARANATQPTANTPRDEIQEATDVRGGRVLTAYAPVPPLRWMVFVELPIDEAYASLYELIRRSAWCCSAASASPSCRGCSWRGGW